MGILSNKIMGSVNNRLNRVNWQTQPSNMAESRTEREEHGLPK